MSDAGGNGADTTCAGRGAGARTGAGVGGSGIATGGRGGAGCTSGRMSSSRLIGVAALGGDNIGASIEVSGLDGAT